MTVLVDTPIWSEFFRRSTPEPAVREGLRRLIDDGEAILLGPVRQEVLSGVRDAKQFVRLRDALRAFGEVPIETADFEEAAAMFNRCRSQGIQGSNTDFLICAVAIRLSAPIFTLDGEFQGFARVLPIRLYHLPP